MVLEPQENSDLLNVRNNLERTEFIKIEPNGTINTVDSTPKSSLDKGIRAYSVVVGSFLINGLLFGVINSYSVIYTVLQQQLNEQGIENSESRAGKLYPKIIVLLFSYNL